MSTSIFQLLMLLFVWNFFGNPLHKLFLLKLMHTKYAFIWSSCIILYEDVNYPFEDDLYILKLP